MSEAIDSVLAQTYQDFGVSRSAVSRRSQEASAKALQGLCERRFAEVDLLIIYLDGKDSGGHQVVSAVGVGLERRVQPRTDTQSALHHCTDERRVGRQHSCPTHTG